MRISPFGVEQWMNAHETGCRWNLAETCVASLTVAELLKLVAGRPEAVWDELLALRLTYGPIEGSDRLRSAVAALYDRQGPANVMVTHGAIGANQLVHLSLVEPGDRVVCLVPTYQQHYSIPASIGADVRLLRLRPEHRWLPDLDELRALAGGSTRLIVIANPNNPTGSLMDAAMLVEIAAIAETCGAWVLSDEVYRGTDQHGPGTTASMADIYPRGISTGSMSKAFSLAGLRLGWIAGPEDLLRVVSVHRDYNTISVSMVDDLLASVALEHRDRILERSRAIVGANLAVLDRWVGDEPLVHYVKPRSGTTALLGYQLERPSQDLCLDLLEQTGVLLTPGSAMDSEGHLRIGYANHRAVLEAGLPLMSRFLRQAAGDARRTVPTFVP
jgi:aspartate/methionine/tyrosine aminotransferase